eukprot:751347-Hanusia_phi.AAC.9
MAMRTAKPQSGSPQINLWARLRALLSRRPHGCGRRLHRHGSSEETSSGCARERDGEHQRKVRQ